MTAFAIALANPIIAGLAFLIFITALYRALTLKLESTHIPTTDQEIKTFQWKKKFLWFSALVFGLLPVLNFILVMATGI